jgi:hypothetical protein
MAGGTHVFDMIKRLKENENLKKNNYFKTKGTYEKIDKTINVDFRQASTSEREEIRRLMAKERRHETRRFIITLVLSTGLTALILFLFSKFVRP